MSSLVRTIQRRAKRGLSGVGSRLGVHDENAGDLVARLIRETKREDAWKRESGE